MKWRSGITVPIDPDAVKDYVFDWKKWLATDTIKSYVLTPSLTVTVVADSNDTTTVTVWVSATASGTVKCHVVSVGEREDDRTVGFEVVEL